MIRLTATYNPTRFWVNTPRIRAQNVAATLAKAKTPSQDPSTASIEQPNPYAQFPLFLRQDHSGVLWPLRVMIHIIIIIIIIIIITITLLLLLLIITIIIIICEDVQNYPHPRFQAFGRQHFLQRVFLIIMRPTIKTTP